MSIRNILSALFGKREVNKEDWEFEWQRKYWASMYQEPEVRKKVKEYWDTHRHLGDILRHVRIEDSTRILDVGCGISTVLHYLPGQRHGIDPLGERYKQVYPYPGDIHIQSGYGESIPFPDDSFDVAFSSNCIDHTTDPVKTMQEVRRVLKPGGFFVLTCEVFRQDLGQRNEGHPHSMTEGTLTNLASSFTTVERWKSPWYGLRNYALAKPPTDQEEHIFLLRNDKPAART